MSHRKDISPIFKNETPSGLKTTYPIIFGIWYGIWCTALHLLQSIDIFMDNAPAGAGAGAGAGEGATVQGASHRHRYLRQGQARARQTCQNSVNFSTKNKVIDA